MAIQMRPQTQNASFEESLSKSSNWESSSYEPHEILLFNQFCEKIYYEINSKIGYASCCYDDCFHKKSTLLYLQFLYRKTNLKQLLKNRQNKDLNRQMVA